MTRIVKRTLFISFGLFIGLVLLPSIRREDVEASSRKHSKPKIGKRTQNAPTFTKEVVRIFQKNCQTCHHPGDIAPFSLMTYKEARPWAQSIREQVILRKMPPWKPAPGCGDFRDPRGLSNEEIQTIVAWVDAGAPEGNQADMPAPLEFPDGWALGAPDLIVSPDTDYTPPTQGDMYRCFSVPVTGLRGDRWISALSVRPGNPRIVHHVIAYPDSNGVSAQLDAADPDPGYTCFGGPGFDTSDFLGGWAPGSRGYFAPQGAGIKLSNNSRVVIQVHYHPTGVQETDRTPVGLYFAKSPVRKQLQALPLLNNRFEIPAGAKHYEVTASYTIPPFISAQMWVVTPHMHLLGRKIKVELNRPGAFGPDCLVNIEDWNFNWQGTYLYNNPIELTSGSSLKLTTIFDNSTDNPLNPNNPPKPVRWGEETTDEMSLAFIGFTLNGATLPISTPSLNEATVDQNGNLIVSGAGFLPGADIEINGRSLRDTTADSATLSTRLSSSELWKVYAAPGQEVNVTALNPDGVRTSARTFIRPGTARSLAAVSAANYSPDSLAPESITAAFGTNLATSVMAANSRPLPTSLAGTSVRVNGVLAPLFFVAPTQVNFIVPAGTLTGSAVIEILSGDSVLSRGQINLASAAPSLFTSNAQGTGAPAAVATKDGVNFILVGNVDGSPNELDAGDYLVLFGTGIRYSPRGSVKITIGGVDCPALYSGAQGDFAGLDQINTQLPRGISGIVDLVVSVNGRAANETKLRIR
jgi:uncharacterized protein (TIGR03437 family)